MRKFDKIKSALDEYYLELDSRKEGFGTSGYFKKSSEEAEKDFVTNQAKDIFEKIKSKFAVPEHEEICNTPHFVIETLPYSSLSKKEVLFEGKMVNQAYRLEYYFGDKVRDMDFIGLTTSINFPYKSKFFNKELLGKGIGSVKGLEEVLEEFEQIGSFVPPVNGIYYNKKIFQGIDDLVLDEGITSDMVYEVNFRFFQMGVNTNLFSDFLDLVYKKVQLLNKE